MKARAKATDKAIHRATDRRTQKTVVVVPMELAAEIDGRVRVRNRQKFVIENCMKELRRLDQVEAIRQATGAWRKEDHPELAEVYSRARQNEIPNTDRLLRSLRLLE